tara:strand:- start:158 stop:340 length:183 start_codon:yes stop_codon:yes gene_type:complete
MHQIMRSLPQKMMVAVANLELIVDVQMQARVILIQMPTSTITHALILILVEFAGVMIALA